MDRSHGLSRNRRERASGMRSFGMMASRVVSPLLLALLLGKAAISNAQAGMDTASLPDHWHSVDLREWAWYLNFTSEQKRAVHAIDDRCIQREIQVVGPTDYVETEELRAHLKAIVKDCTEEVRTVLDPPRFARWLFIRNGGRPIKPRPISGGRIGVGIF